MDILEKLSGRREMVNHGNGDVRDIPDEDCVEAAAEISRLRAALLKAEEADEQHNNCDECALEEAPETCPKCFPLADDARLMRWAALGIGRPAYTEAAGQK